MCISTCLALSVTYTTTTLNYRALEAALVRSGSNRRIGKASLLLNRI